MPKILLYNIMQGTTSSPIRYRNAVGDFQYWMDENGQNPRNRTAGPIINNIQGVLAKRSADKSGNNPGKLGNCQGLPDAPPELAEGIPLEQNVLSSADGRAIAHKLDDTLLSKKLIRCIVDRNLGIIKQTFNFQSKRATYAAFYAFASRESTCNLDREGFIFRSSTGAVAKPSYCTNKTENYGVFQTPAAAFGYNDVPEIRHYFLTYSNVLNPYISAETGVRSVIHFAKEAMRKTTPGLLCPGKPCIPPDKPNANNMPAILKFVAALAGHDTGKVKSIKNNAHWANTYASTVIWSYYYYLTLPIETMNSTVKVPTDISYSWSGKCSVPRFSDDLGDMKASYIGKLDSYARYFDTNITACR